MGVRSLPALLVLSLGLILPTLTHAQDQQQLDALKIKYPGLYADVLTKFSQLKKQLSEKE